MRTPGQENIRRVKQRTQVGCWHGPAKQVPLNFVDTVLSGKQFELLLGLDTFDHNVEPQLRAQPCHGAQQGDPRSSSPRPRRNDWSIFTLCSGKLCK